MGFSAFIFDFDYTLGDSTKGITESVNYAFKTMGLEEHPAEEIRKTVGMTLPNAFRYLTCKDNEDSAAEFFRLFKHKAHEIMTENTVLYPDTIPVLSHIKSKGYKTGIVTTKLHYRIDKILHKYNIENLIDTVIGIDDVKNAKPHPEALQKALSMLESAKEDVLYIGDTVIDAEAAFNAEVDFCAVTTGTTDEISFYDFPRIAVIHSLSELLSENIIF
jgi:phosphoglycolate phosphatase